MKDLYQNIKTIIWDWNGTLLDDVNICISCMNSMLAERNLAPLNRERYLDIFTFPVEDYYIRAGFSFDSEPFEVPAHQFIDRYRKEVISAPLHKEVTEVLTYLQGKGYLQTILSAMEREFLMETMSGKDILPFFNAIYGIDNHLGSGKTNAAKQLMGELGIGPEQTVIIGDTLHDAEIARDLGMRCILVSNGHQSYERLHKIGYTVIHRLDELKEVL